MSNEEKLFNSAYDEYELVFGEQFPTMELQDMPLSKITAIMQKCIETKRPYVSCVPDGCLI